MSSRHGVGKLGVGGILEVARNEIPPIKGDGPRALVWSLPCVSGSSPRTEWLLLLLLLLLLLNINIILVIIVVAAPEFPRHRFYRQF